MNQKSFSRIILATAVACTAMLTSCVGINPMVLRNPGDRVDPGKDAVVLMTFKVSNKVKPEYQPNRATVKLGGIFYGSLGDNPARSAGRDFNEYILSMRVASGSRSLEYVVASSAIPMVLGAGSIIPMNMAVNLAPGHVYYLGRVEAVLRKCEKDEPASAKFPLIDQAIAGYSSGAWDVTIRDNYQQDMEMIQSRFTAMQGVHVDKQILPAWTRPSKTIQAGMLDSRLP